MYNTPIHFASVTQSQVFISQIVIIIHCLLSASCDGPHVDLKLSYVQDVVSSEECQKPLTLYENRALQA